LRIKNRRKKYLKILKGKTTLTALFLLLALSASLFAMPIVNAQNYANLVMNPQSDYALIDRSGFDIDLNGPSAPINNVTLWIKYPGRSDFTYIGGFPTTSSGDLDIYTGQSPPTPPFVFNETGDFELQWRVPPQTDVPANPSDPDGYWNSNIEVVSCVTTLPPTVYHTWVYVSASPELTGVGEEMLLVCWTAEMPPDIGEQSGQVSSPTGRAGWYDMKIQVWDPDNQTEIVNMPYSDPVGANYISYTPTKVGTYRIQAIFPETIKENIESGAKRLYTAEKSPIAEFEVVAEQRQPWVDAPLPNNYWTRPLYGASRDWYVLTGNWLSGSANVWPMGGSGGTTDPFGWGPAPESAHILWSKPFYIGGIMDTRFGSINYQTSHYQGVTFGANIILNGKIHTDDLRLNMGTAHGGGGWQVLSLYTGETLFEDFELNDPSFGQIYLYESPNQHGGFSYLWRTSGVTYPDQVHIAYAEPNDDIRQLPVRTRASRLVDSSTISTRGTEWEMIDANTLQTICYIANVSTSGEGVYGKDGSICYYDTYREGGDWRLSVWNSSHGTMVISQQGTGAWQWRPAGGGFGGSNPFFGSTAYDNVHNGELFFCLDVPIPSLSGYDSADIEVVREGEYLIVGDQGWNDEDGITPGWMMGISLERGNEGNKLWESTFTPPFASQALNISRPGTFTGGMQMVGVYPEDEVITFESVRQLSRWGFDLKTGQLLWTITDDPQMNYYGQNEDVYQGLLITSGSYSGKIRAFDIRTGELEWEYICENEGFESPYGNYPVGIRAISDGKIYTTTSEHSYTHPLYRGRNLRCINATDGTEVWSILDFGGSVAIADGILVTGNSMDNRVYCYGKGPSATTVTASPKVSVHGTSVVVEGTVTDQTTSGQRNINDEVDFTLQGTPAISDEDMTAWMEYMFMDQGFPSDAKGVEVTLTVVDPNSNVYEIGTTTSDTSGNFALTFEPLVPGDYQIIACFDGSRSYGPSQATTHMTVEEAPAATPMPTPEPASIADMYFLPVSAGIIIAIVVIGILIILMLRRR
jgi:hypothetical protein